MNYITRILKTIIGQKSLGVIDHVRYWSSRELDHSWGGPFNGQRFRQLIFFELLYNLPIEMIVETGTYHGTTTALFGATALPVYTTEIDSRHYAYSRLRFALNGGNVHLYNEDSRTFLKRMAEIEQLRREQIFFYLDAHWGVDVPLSEELGIILETWTRFVVMIDDFCVPGSAYRFDDYGPDKALTAELISETLTTHHAFGFYPSVGSELESGARRGSVVICDESSAHIIENKVKSLKRI